jgi:hypothetical protein
MMAGIEDVAASLDPLTTIALEARQWLMRHYSNFLLAR